MPRETAEHGARASHLASLFKFRKYEFSQKPTEITSPSWVTSYTSRQLKTSRNRDVIAHRPFTGSVISRRNLVFVYSVITVLTCPRFMSVSVQLCRSLPKNIFNLTGDHSQRADHTMTIGRLLCRVDSHVNPLSTRNTQRCGIAFRVRIT